MSSIKTEAKPWPNPCSAPGGGFAAVTDEHWQHALNSNLFAAVRLDRGLLALMLEQGAEANTSSTGAPSRRADGDCTIRRSGKLRSIVKTCYQFRTRAVPTS